MPVVLVRFYSDFNFLYRYEKSSNIKYHILRIVGAGLLHDADSHTWRNGRVVLSSVANAPRNRHLHSAFFFSENERVQTVWWARKKFKIKLLNHLTIVLLEHFRVAAEHHFDGETLNLLRTAGLNLSSTKVQYFAILDNACVWIDPSKSKTASTWLWRWRVVALHALLLTVGLILYQFFVSRDCPSGMLKLLAHVQKFAFTLMHETFIYHLTQSLRYLKVIDH